MSPEKSSRDLATSVEASERDAALRSLVPEGLDPPPDIPQEIFRPALGVFLERRRLDMRGLAESIGVSRATLYRRVRGRDHLLGEMIWFLTRHAVARAVAETAGRRGRSRVLGIVAGFMHDVNEQPALRRLLDEEPEAALRILTSKHGPVQTGLIAAVERLLDQERKRGHLDTGIEPATLAYVIVRIGESFLYADAIADNEPDVELAVAMIAKLLRAA
jgi:AcrR family transcriptional regulator